MKRVRNTRDELPAYRQAGMSYFRKLTIKNE